MEPFWNTPREELFRQWLKSLRGMRHEYMNEIQVLSSYLLQNRQEEGRRYLERISQRLLQESWLVQLDYPPLSVYLLTFSHLHSHLQLDVELDGPWSVKELAISPTSLLTLIQEWLEVYLRHADRQWANHLSMQWLRKKKNLEIVLDFEGSLDAGAALEDLRHVVAGQLRRLQEEGGNEMMQFVEGIHNTRESLMQFSLSLR